MGNLRKSGFLLLLFFGAFRVCAQQTVQFSQYVFNGLAVNPAYAGYRGRLDGKFKLSHAVEGNKRCTKDGGQLLSMALPMIMRKRVGLGLSRN